MSWLKRHLPTKRWKRLCLYLASTLLILLAADILLTQYWRHIEIAPDTTRITAPLNPDGTPDYLAALNALASEGVTRENNAAPLLLEVFGTNPYFSDNAPLAAEWRQKALPPLGISTDVAPPLFTKFEKWSKEHPAATLPATAPATAPAAAPADANLAAYHELLDMTRAPWNSATHPRWAQWLADQKEALARTHIAVEKPRFHIPYVELGSDRLIGVGLTHLGTGRDLGQTLVADAMRALGDGDFPAFQRNIADALRLSRLTGQGLTLMESMVARSSDSTAFDAIKHAAATPGALSPDQARQLLAMLDSLPPLPPQERMIDTGARWDTLDIICAASAEGWPARIMSEGFSSGWWLRKNTVLPIHYNQLLREANAFYDGIVESRKLPTYRQRFDAAKIILDDFERRKAASVWTKTTNPSAAINVALLDNFLAPMNKVMGYEEASHMDRQLARLALALRIYKTERGSFPDSLDALAPAYLPEIPQDTFIEAPLKYRKEAAGYLLYSVGPNEIDEGGVEQIGDKKKGDLVARAAE